MKFKFICYIFLLVLLESCNTRKKNIITPMTEKMYQVSKKNYLKKYTRKFLKTIPKRDMELITRDSIQIIYDTIKNDYNINRF